MQKVVIDTNVIVSAALTEKGNPAEIMRLVSEHKLCMFYSEDILREYTEVISRSKFGISTETQLEILTKIIESGILVEPAICNVELQDETDRIFYDAARESGAVLVTGNIKDYPNEPFILTPAQFLDVFLS